VTFALCADLFNWKPAPWLLMIGIIWAVTFYPSARGIFLGQPGTMAVCLELIAVWALAKRHDAGAGVVLALSLIKIQLGLLIIPFMLLYALRFRRWRFIISFVISSGILVGLSFLLEPSWLGAMLQQATKYNGYTQIGSPIWVITNYYLPFLGDPVDLLITVLLIVVMLWVWVRVIWRRDASLFAWGAALSLTITHLVLVRTATPHFVVYLIVIVFYFRQLSRTYGRWAVLGAMAALTIGLWWLFLATLVGKFESPVNYLPLPWGALILLLLTRKQWHQPVAEPTKA
jgi:hypothetical protein